MPRRHFPYFGAICLLAALGCTRAATKAQPIAEAYVPDSRSVGFDIESWSRENGSLRIQASYPSQGKLAKSGIEFGPAGSVERIEDWKQFPITTGKGKFVAEPGSNAAVLLADLGKALEAKTNPSHVHRVEALRFTFVALGDNNSQARGGGFNADPPGGWTAVKIFIGDGKQEGQVFLGFNPAIRKGQFSMKDPEYGDIVLKQLAAVL